MEQQDVLKLKNKVVYLLDNSKTDFKGILVSRSTVNNFFTDNVSFTEELQNNFDVDYLSFSDIIKDFLIVLKGHCLRWHKPTSSGYKLEAYEGNPLRDTDFL
jgi:hypothetical protein